jgi:hypothetical protein
MLKVGSYQGLSCQTQGSFSAEVVETLAIQEIHAGRFEGPCTGHIVAHIRVLLGSFSIGRIQYKPHETNKVAHLMAQHAKEIEHPTIWFHSSPVFIFRQLLRDGMIGT